MIGHIYAIIYVINPHITYFGSTILTIRHRWSIHNYDYKNNKNRCSIVKYFDMYGIDKFIIKLIKSYNVVDKKHLTSYEQLFINKFSCVNYNNPWAVSICSHKLFKKIDSKKRNDDNRNIKHMCLCGMLITTNQTIRHLNTKKHKKLLFDA